MNYKLKFIHAALNEWKRLDSNTQDRFKRKLKECLVSPRSPENNLSGFENHYKISLRASSYRLVYEVDEKELYVLGISFDTPEEGQILH